MIIDYGMKLTADAGQTVTNDAETTNVFDQKKAGGAIDGLYINVQCLEAADNAGDDASVTFILQTSDAEDFSSGVLVAAQSEAIAQADLTANKIVWQARVPAKLLRYLRGYHDVGNAPLTKGKFRWFFSVSAEVN